MSKREYHYVITLQFTKEGVPGVNVTTIEGTVDAARGSTRMELYRDVYARACKESGVVGAATLFCMLEPNAL